MRCNVSSITKCLASIFLSFFSLIKENPSKTLTILGLILGVYGAFISVGDDIASMKRKRDSSQPWSSIRAGLKELERFEIDAGLQSKISRLYNSQEGFHELLSIVKRNTDLSPYGIPVALFAQERGISQHILGKFRRGSVFFGIVNQQNTIYFVEDMALLREWVRDYRKQFYVKRGLRYILFSFFLQLIATLVPAKIKKKVNRCCVQHRVCNLPIHLNRFNTELTLQFFHRMQV